MYCAAPEFPTANPLRSRLKTRYNTSDRARDSKNRGLRRRLFFYFSKRFSKSGELNNNNNNNNNNDKITIKAYPCSKTV